MTAGHTSLKELILETLRTGGPMTFERYMALCLYHPQCGYYTQGRQRTGAGGDYFTSADLDPVFARLVARQAAEMWELMGRPERFTWVEMGAGRGLFACDFLSWVVQALPEFAAALEYVAIEPWEGQRRQIAERLAASGLGGRVRLVADLGELRPPPARAGGGGMGTGARRRGHGNPARERSRVGRLPAQAGPHHNGRHAGATESGGATGDASAPDGASTTDDTGVAHKAAPNRVTGCFFSNELVDAFPVSVVTRVGGQLREIYVRAGASGGLAEGPGPISDPSIAAYVARYAPELEEGCCIEVNRQAQAWMRAVAAKLERGFVLTIDYGDIADRLYSLPRPRGTLLAYSNHAAHQDFYGSPGLADLTAHVNFKALMDEGGAAGLETCGFTTQEKFLLALGESSLFAELYDPGQSEIERLKARLKLKRLISPAGMGSTFKVLVQQRGVGAASLTGLRYAGRG